MSIKFVTRPSEDRGHADHGWLKSFHTFSFATYQDAGHDQYGCLRVLNEDRVEPRTGFGTHGHREFEIFSYIVSGQLEHEDSMGNREVLKRGDLQMTSAGTGIRHSEKAYGDDQVHFIQIWSIPSQRGRSPQYFTRHFSDEEKKDWWARVVAPAGSAGVLEKREAAGPAPVHSTITLYASLISPSTTLSHTLPRDSDQPRKAYIHVIQTSGYNTDKASGARIKLSVSGGNAVEVAEGDGVYIMGDAGATFDLQNIGDSIAEVLLFDC